MKEMRRLEIPQKSDVFERGRTSVVRSFEIAREDIERLQKERPDLVLSEEAGVMVLHPQGKSAWLYYGFDRLDALRQRFRPMFEKLLGALRKGEASSGVLLRFTDQPNRPYIEPVLADNLFELRHEWMEMTLAELPEEPLPPDEIVQGFPLRPVVPADHEAVAALDQAAFANNDVLQPDDIADIARRAAELRVLEERTSGRLAGHIGLFLRPERTGEIAPIGVHPDFRRRGLGEAMCRWGLARLRQQAMRRAKLTVHADNAAAIGLYRKLGFVPGQRGLTYRHPTDKQELARLAQKKKGTYIKFGDWR